ncbi:Hypothetical predicted protein, partial [Mytilus galloprovincialis]
MIDTSNPEIILGTETLLRPDILSSEIFPPQYSVYRKDRTDGYGGVLIAVKDIIISEELPVRSDTESLYIRLTTPDSKSIIVGCLYRPPSSDITYMDKMSNTTEEIFKENNSSILWLGGDLNLPDIDWKSNSVCGNQYSSQINN